MIIQAVSENQNVTIPVTFIPTPQASASPNSLVGTAQLRYVGVLKARVFEHLGWSDWIQIGNIFSRKFFPSF